MFQGTNSLENECSSIRTVWELFAPGIFTPGSKVPTGNFQSQERQFSLGTFAPGSESSRELLFKGVNVPGNTHSAERDIPVPGSEL